MFEQLGLPVEAKLGDHPNFQPPSLANKLKNSVRLEPAAGPEPLLALDGI